MSKSLTTSLPSIAEIERLDSCYHADCADNIPTAFIKAAFRARRYAAELEKIGARIDEDGDIVYLVPCSCRLCEEGACGKDEGCKQTGWAWMTVDYFIRNIPKPRRGTGRVAVEEDK